VLRQVHKHLVNARTQHQVYRLKIRACTSARDGVCTFVISWRVSFKNSMSRCGPAVARCIALGSLVSTTAAFAMDVLLKLLLRSITDIQISGRGARIRTEKFGFGDRQFNR
jgi:hypothetical protein